MEQLRDNLSAKLGETDFKYFRIQKGRYHVECRTWEDFIDEVRVSLGLKESYELDDRKDGHAKQK